MSKYACYLPIYYEFMKAITKQFSCFFIVGALSALIQFSILISFVEFLFIEPILASTLGYIAGALINYTLNHYFTFKVVYHIRNL